MDQAQRYKELAARTEGKTLDSSYHAAFYLLSCEQGIFDVAKKHVNAMGIGFDGLKRSMRGFDGTSLQVVEIAAGITMHVIGQIVIYIKYWEKDWGKR